MKALKHLALAVAVVAGMVSCANPDKIHFKGIEDASMGGLKTVQLTAGISNDSHCNVHILRAHLALMDRNSVVAELVLSDKVTVPRRSDGAVTLPFNLVLSNPMALLMLPAKLKKGSEDLTVSGDMTVRGGLARKSYSLDPTPLNELLYKAGITPDELVKYFKR